MEDEGILPNAVIAAAERGWLRMLIGLIAGTFIGWLSELTSVRTGFPFSWYEYRADRKNASAAVAKGRTLGRTNRENIFVTLRQTLLITGASSGIGKEIAALAAARGHTVIASALTQELLADIPGSASMKLVIDICDQHSIEQALDNIDLAGIKLTCLVNNAGYAQPGPIELVDDTQVRRQFDVNVFGTLAMTRAILPLLRKQSRPDRHSLIITLSSMLGLVSSPYQGIYAASKHALEGAFSALRMEVRAQNIDVVLVEPGWISTHFLKTAMSHAPKKWLENKVYGASLKNYFAMTNDAETENPTGAAKIAASLAGTPQDVAAVVIRALESKMPKARYPVTALAKWMPRIARIIPTRLWDKMQTRDFSR